MDIFKRQQIITETIEKMKTNFKKDSASRKTVDYITKRSATLQALWDEFEVNHRQVQKLEDKTLLPSYYEESYQQVKQMYETLREQLQNCDTASSSSAEKGIPSQTDELFNQQGTNFRALTRLVRNLKLDLITEKWEVEDKLQMLQSRWKAIDEIHWKLDSIFIGSDLDYEEEFNQHEQIYEQTKKQLYQKLNGSVQQQQATPRIEIPTFAGNYTQWTTFMDLYCEAIHNNNTIPKAQKMQHLKGKLRGEAERLVQHLAVSVDNYDTCWDILCNRYNNKQLLFTKLMHTFLNQPAAQQQTASELKRLHDTSLEAVHAIHNLGIDTSTWDPFLVHILTTKLDSDTYTSYMEARKSPRELPQFDELILFLENKFIALEPLIKKKQPFSQPAPKMNHGIVRNMPSTSSSNTQNHNNFKRFVAKSFPATTERNCPICKTNHILMHCKTFQNMTPSGKMTTITKLNICQNCLFSHNGRQCNSIKRCKVCNKSHHTAIHDLIRDFERNCISATSATTSPGSQDNLENLQKCSNHVNGNFNEVLLATVQIKIRAIDGTLIQLRCLLDQGSQINLITESAAQKLGLKRNRQSATVSGIGLAAKQSKGTVQLSCESLNGDHSFTTDALVMTTMINNLPNYSFAKQQWPHLNNINLADPDYNISRPVDVLLDAGVYADIVMGGILRGPENAPIAQQTKLGWVLLGNVKPFNCYAVINNLDELAQFWEIEEITETSNNMSQSEEYCETLYKTTTNRLPNGRYEVKIPMQQNFEQHLGPSKPQAVAQFLQLEKRLAKNETLSVAYKAFMNEYIALGHMTKCTLPREPSCFVPHHGVLRLESTTTKLRAVFNASCPTKSGYSLNQLMEGGPNLQQDLQAMILRWRSFRYVYTADIEKFYRQIFIKEEDQHLQKIVWRNTETEPIKEYQLCTVTYGTKSAPYLAMRTIKQLVRDDGPQNPLAAEILKNQLYVDDLLGGSNDLSLARTTQKQLISLLQGGGFNLRKWASNHPELLDELTEDQISQNMLNITNIQNNKTLGILWNPCTDQFTFNIANLCTNKDNVITKRTLLSDLSKIYDPLGWLSPVTMKGKIIFQQVWKQPLAWDEPLPQLIQTEWALFRNELPILNKITMPRCIGNTCQQIELHGFCDASERGFACVIYCKSTYNNQDFTIKQIAGKTKLAPVNKHITLPRLELCGAVLLSKLMNKTIDSLNTKTVQIYGWTDSTVVLGWLQGDITRWRTFVANRVDQIRQVIPTSCWRHVRSEDNPADCASRGILPSQLLNHCLWWEGPQQIKENMSKTTAAKSYEEPAEDRKGHRQTYTARLTSPIVEELLHNNSSITRVTRILGWISRFINNASRKSKTGSFNLTTAELNRAHTSIIQTVQNKYFAKEIEQLQKNKNITSKGPLAQLNPFLNQDNVLCVGGRLKEATISDSQKNPIILPHNDKLTELLIDLAHITTLHGGPRLTLSHLRNKYWILRGVRTTKGRLRRCIKCHRFKSTTNNQLMADLPAPRVTPSRPFTHTGVDFTGQVEVKANKGRGIKTTKGYIAVFVCLATKAAHLELVSDLSSETFLAAFRRLCARRGSPQHLYSDNGTNFVGAARILAQERNEALQHYANTTVMDTLSNQGIEWHFNAPAWASAGGLWERLVRSTKHHLRRVLGDQKLTFEEFSTLLAQIEGCLNSRPLLPLTEDIDDLECLTPGHFLVGGPVLAGPLSPEIELRGARTRWQLTEKLHRNFWKKWSNEYLQTLQTRSKWTSTKRNLKVNDMVLVKEDNTPPARWLLGRVIELHPGKDGHVRVVSLKTKNNVMKRPITKLAPLPMDEEEEQDTDNNHPPTKPAAPSNKPRPKKTSTCTYICLSLLLMLMAWIPTSTCQINGIRELNPSKQIYFDKVADMQIVQDQWKMVVYYNMKAYWKGLITIEKYVNHLTALCNQETAFTTIASQLQHEMNELQHYNKILSTEHATLSTRRKRGLIDGVGYIANSLFGVLDERFAEQYDKDIQLVRANENHLLSLFKNHTSIIEGEYNLLQRNEQLMNQQFTTINQHLVEQDKHNKAEHQNTMYITATALAANMILANLRRIQQMLLDLITDVKDGRVDTHLIQPDQFEEQLNLIAGKLPGDLSLPCINNQHCTKDMYKLARVHVHLTNNFLLFEFKLPLVNTETYELNRLIPIPQMSSPTTQRIIITPEYLAINLRKDAVIRLTHQDISSCQLIQEHQLLCDINLPIYDIKASVNICEAQLINNKKLSSCQTITSECADKWIRLHRLDTWLFACCGKCAVRTFCPGGVTSLTLRDAGLITLKSGCMLKGDLITIHSHNNFHSKINVNEDDVYVPISSVNDVLEVNNITFTPEDHHEVMTQLKSSIETVKVQQQTLNEITSSHDVHHYAFIVFMTITLIVAVIWISCYIRRRINATQVIVLDHNAHQEDNISSFRESRNSDTTTEGAAHATKYVNKGTSP